MRPDDLGLGEVGARVRDGQCAPRSKRRLGRSVNYVWEMDQNPGEEGYGEVEIPRAGGPITALGGGILRSRFTARGIRREWMPYWCSLNAR